MTKTNGTATVRHWHRRFIALAGCAVLLAACDSLPPVRSPSSKPVSTKTDAANPAKTHAAGKTTESAKTTETGKTAESGKDTAKDNAATNGKKPVRETALLGLPPLRLSALVGKNTLEISDELGPAQQIVENPPSIIWTYKGRNCTLHLHFYLEVKNKAYLVLTTSIDGAKQDPAAKQRCLDSVRALRAQDSKS